MPLNATGLQVPLPISSGILNLHGWKVTALAETKNSYTVEAEYDAPTICPQCGGTEYVRFGVREQEYHDLPVHMKKVAIQVKRQRYKCKACGYVYVPPIPYMHDDHQMTDRLVEFICKQSVRAPTFAALGRLIGLHETTIKNVFTEYLIELDRNYVIETPEWLGIDEVKLGGQMRVVFTNVRERKPIALLPVYEIEVVREFMLKKLDRAAIKGVVIDMSPMFRSAVEELLPDAIVIVDKFHIVKKANECLDKVRKDIRKRDDMPHAQSKQLKKNRRWLMMNEKNLNDGQKFKLSVWLLNFDSFGKAYAAKEAYKAIWNSDTREIAEYLYNERYKKLDPEINPFFLELMRATKNWWAYIFNYFEYRFTNAYTEAANGMMKEIQKAGRGYSFDVIRAKLVYGLAPETENEVIPPDWW